MRFTNLFILILATFRITNLFIDERGPYNIFGLLRERLGIMEFQLENGEIRKEVLDNTNELGQLFTCIWCLSPYIATFLLLLPKKFQTLITLPFALSAGAIIIKERLNK